MGLLEGQAFNVPKADNSFAQQFEFFFSRVSQAFDSSKFARGFTCSMIQFAECCQVYTAFSKTNNNHIRTTVSCVMHFARRCLTGHTTSTYLQKTPDALDSDTTNSSGEAGCEKAVLEDTRLLDCVTSLCNTMRSA